MLLIALSKKELPTINPNDYYCFQKYDGFRCIWDLGRLYGRSLEQFSYYFPEIVKALQPYLTCVLDGELINANGVSKPHLLQSRLRSNPFHIKVMSGLFDSKIPATLPARFMIFDILEKEGQDLRNLPFEQRQYILQETIKENEWLQIIKPIQKSFVVAFNEVTGQEGEGLVLKRKGSIYVETLEDKRTGLWLKVKKHDTTIIKFTSYEIQNAGVTLTDGTHRVACNGHQHKEVKEMIDNKGFAFVEIGFLEQTQAGMYRQPTFQRLIK